MGGGEGEVNARLMMKAIQEQFKASNTKLDDLQSMFRFRSPRENTYEEREEKYSNENTRSRKEGDSIRDDYLRNINMTILVFQDKNDLELFRVGEKY